MGRAVIVFSDGSKQIAHNLDDSKFRWYERKISEDHNASEVLKHLQPGIIIRDCSLPANYEQAEQWRSEVAAQYTALGQYIQVLKSQGIDYYKRYGHQTRIGMLEVQQQLKNLKEYRIRTTGLAKPEKADKRAGELKSELLKAQRHIIRLQSTLLEQFGITDDEIESDES